MVKCAAAQEQAVVFGCHDHLVGILRHPKAETRTSKSPATTQRPLHVLMLNAGMLHSAGPFRLHVDLARALGNAGVTSLRMDVSGIGESLPVGTRGTSLQRVATEVSAAMDYLQINCGADRFAVFGLCAGADDALYAALQDDRIERLFCVDGLGYRTNRYYWHRWHSYYLPKLLSPRKWKYWLRKAVGQIPAAPPSLQFGDDIREFPPREKARQQLKQLIDRGVRMHFHYTGGVGGYYNYAEQFQDMFPELFAAGSDGQVTERLVTTSFHPQSDHVGFLCEHRAQLVSLATTKLQEP